ncbi:hydroxymethylglutaryl-CoA lyase [Persicitalea jodogahamensis]|uniref:Hydroxymethylglutaryl-CoA lyase n=1 Tax=Persicitalea jodogahamensis TaxID=402147 RepID=A0A8J3G8N2_9BACT|nr:hydroxymethylglutaryl-CoA lyase [Persicitalea jodogahamensis]GHB57069.1 hydroxymethylglutaryl-CoA lyase [Persicitalea jodogahamensis]
MKLIECPRDAWQGHHPFIPTEQKIRYLNLLLQVGFETLDFGSFVSPKAMPQVSDTAEVVERLDLETTDTKLLAIVANERGAEQACTFAQIRYLGYPFSISETFQLRNTNANLNESVERVRTMQKLCEESEKELVVYISMGFGNPYGDPWSPQLAEQRVEELAQFGVKIFSLSDTVGVAHAHDIRSVFQKLIAARPDLEFGAHFHTTPHAWREKVQAAYESGCRRFDGALLGYGGCPMAQDDLVGNMPTERLLEFADEKKELPPIDQKVLGEALNYFRQIIG